MHSLDDVDDPADEPRSFRSHPAWQRIVVLCAGSFMHFVLAFVLIFGLALGIGITALVGLFFGLSGMYRQIRDALRIVEADSGVAAFPRPRRSSAPRRSTTSSACSSAAGGS